MKWLTRCVIWVSCNILVLRFRDIVCKMNIKVIKL